MPKFRKKPIIIEAEQWFPGQDIKGVVRNPCFSAPSQQYCVQTLEGPLNVHSGDWIITGVKGEKYPCKPDIFEQTYELVEE